jgi:signal transduction histidine kinase
MLTGVLVALTVIGLVRLGPDHGSVLQGPAVSWALLALGFGLAEVFVIHIRIGRDAHSFSLSEVPLVIGLAFAPPLALVLSQALGVGAALTLHRRQRLLRTAFNLGQRSATTTMAVFLFGALHGALGSTWPAVWAAAAVTTICVDVVSAILINLAISLSEGGANLFDQVIGVGTLWTVANTALGLVAMMVMTVEPLALLLLLAPIATTVLAGRAYADLHTKHEELSMLQRSTRLADTLLDLEQMLPPLLDQVRQIFHADVAELVQWPQDPGAQHLASQVGPGEEGSVLRPQDALPDRGVWARVSSEREGILLARPIKNRALAAYYAERGIVDAIVVPMLSDGDIMGMLTVANRLGEFATFSEDDLRLLQVLANHISISVRNARLVEQLSEALEHERHLATIKDDFVATISHELRTPLTNVQGYIKTLLNPSVTLSSEEREDFLASADRQSERLKGLIEDLLFVSNVEGSPSPEAPESHPLGELIERIVNDRAGPHRVDRIALSYPADLPIVRTRVEDLSRLVGNLVDNALKYSTAEVRVEVRHESVGIRVSVEDRGCGVSAGEAERIFDRFYQVDGGLTRRVGGAGMGLYICRRSAEALGGRVWLERSDGHGSTFCAWVPSDVPSPGRPALVALGAEGQ